MDIRNFFGGGKKKTPKKKGDSDCKDETAEKSATAAAAATDAASAAANDNSADVKKPKSSEKKALTMEERRRRALEDSDDSDQEQPTKKPTEAIKREAVSSPGKKAAPPTRTSPRNKRHASPVKKEEKKRRIYESSSEDDDDKMDEDFRNDEKADRDESEDDFEEPSKQQPPKKASTKKRATASPVKKQSAKKIKVEETAAAALPKYHPPSSRITADISFLENNSSIQIQPHIKLITKGKSLTEAFNVDNMTPLCLEGLTFVFTGVLTTNTAKSTVVNSAIAAQSPSKGEYYTNRNAYTTSTIDGIGSNEELPRDIASDLIKMLGGRVTGSVSGKTDYLVCGSILEDGRAVEEGSKYKKCVDMYEAWGSKYRSDYGNNGKVVEMTKKKGKAATKGSDPNSLVEIINGVDEFWGLIKFMSEWKRGTLSEEERAKLESSQCATATEVKREAAKPCVQPAPTAAAAAASNPYTQKKLANPYAKPSAPANPYAKTSAPANPYAKTHAPANPYAKPTNPYAKKATSTQATTNNDKQSAPRKTFQVNALWADKYAPSNSREILGNADSVNKLFKWLNTWEDQFNNPKRRPKSISGPNGPWKVRRRCSILPLVWQK